MEEKEFLREKEKLKEVSNNLENEEKEIEKKVVQTKDEQPVSRIPLSREVSEMFEKWRRGNL